jgi:hypothetical protein
MWAAFFNFPDCIDEINTIGIVLIHACRQSQNIGIKNNVVWGKTDFVDQNFVSPFANPYFIFEGGCLPLLIECHHNYCSSVPKGKVSLFFKSFCAFL